MTEQRHKTVLEIAVDDRGVKDLEKSISRAFDPEQARQFSESLERSARAMEGLQEALGNIKLPGTSGGSGGGGGGGGPRDPQFGPTRQTQEREEKESKKRDARDERDSKRRQQREEKAAANKQRRDEQGEQRRERDDQREREHAREVVSRAIERTIGVAGAAAAGGFTTALAGAVPYIGGGMSAVLGGVQSFYGEFAQAQTALARSSAISNVDRLDPEQFTRYGFGPMEAASLLSQNARASGRTGPGLQGVMPTQLRLQSLMGVQGGAGLVGAAEQRGGTADASRLMMDAVSTGLAAGIRDTELDKYLANVSSWVDRVRTEGIDMSAESALAMARGLSGMGPAFRGMAGAKRAQDLADALAGSPDREGLGTGLAFEAARRVAGPQASIEDLVQLLEQRDTRVMAMFVQMARQTMGDTLGLRALLKSMGVEMPIAQLRGMQGGEIGGFQGGAGPEAENALRGRARTVEPGLGAARMQAEMGFRRYELGGREEITEAARNMMDRDLALAEKLLPQAASVIDKVFEFAENFLKGPAAATQGALNQVGESIGVDKLGDNWREGIKDGVGGALREFFTADTMSMLAKTMFGIGDNVKAAEDAEYKYHEALKAAEEAAKNGGKPAAPVEVPAGGGGAVAQPPVRSSSGAVDGPHSALPRGAVPALRDAARKLDHAASELERSQLMSDGALGFG